MPDRRRLPAGRIHHVAIVVKSLEDALPMYRDLLGLPLETITDIESDHVRIAFLGVGDLGRELADGRPVLAGQLAELVLEKVDPAPGDGIELAVVEHRDRRDPAGIDALDGALDAVARLVELRSRLEEIHGMILAGH